METGGCIGRSIKYMACRDNETASREHIDRCATSILELPKALSTNYTNPLYDVLNDDVMIRKGRRIKTAEESIKYIHGSA